MKKLRLKDFIELMKEKLNITSKSEPIGIIRALTTYLISDFDPNTPILDFFGSIDSNKWKDLERMYYLHSNRKYISTNVCDTLEMYEDDPNTVINQLASYIRYEFEEKWSHIIDVMEREYNPINNYDMIEHEETNIDISDKLSHNIDKETNVTVEADSVIENDVSGFNGNGYAPSSRTRTTADPTKNENKTTETALAEDNYDENVKTANAEDNYRDLTRSGNIGVTTSQQMISSELELRRNIILNDIFNDIDKVLCLKVY